MKPTPLPLDPSIVAFEGDSLYEDLLDLAGEGYCVIEMVFDDRGSAVDYVFLEVNRNFETQTGMRSAKGKRVRELVPDIEDFWLELYGKVALTGRPLRIIDEVKSMDRWFEIKAMRIGGASSRKIAVLFKNITDAKRIEAELHAALALAEDANRAKSEFLSNMSHDLRSPLNAILGFAQLLEAGSPALTMVQKDSVNQILTAGWYLLKLINEILDLALIDSGKLSISLEPIPVAEVLLECQAMIEPMARSKGIRLSLSGLDGTLFALADRTRVKQIVINLLSNSIKYNVANGTVRVTCRVAASGRIRIEVQDTGIGLSPEHIAKLFTPFERLGQESGTEQGTGIGLAVSKRMVEVMEGAIGVESTVGVGSVFWIELAQASLGLSEPETEMPMREAELLEEGPHASTVLYIEDNPANLLLVERILARRPHIRLLSATEGVRGVELAQRWLPDAIVMDINLPGISGFEARRLLANDVMTAHIPVIALSANAMPHDISRGIEAGFCRYLTKPINVGEFIDALDLALAATRPPTEVLQ